MKMLFRSGDIGATVREIEFKTDIFLFHSITDLPRKTDFFQVQPIYFSHN